MIETDAYTLKTLVITGHLAIPDELDLRLTRDRLQVGVEDGRFLLAGLVVPMSI